MSYFSYSYSAFSQIRSLITSAATSNSLNIVNILNELKSTISLYGDDAKIYSITCLLQDIEIPSSDYSKNTSKIYLLRQLLSDSNNNNISLLSRSIENVFMSQNTEIHNSYLIELFGKVLTLNIISLPLSLIISVVLHHSSNTFISHISLSYILYRLDELVNKKIEFSISLNVFFDLITIIKNCNNIPSNNKNIYIDSLKALYPNIDSLVHPVTNISNSESFSISNIMKDIGPSVCSSTESFKSFIASLNITLNESDIAALIGMIARNTSSEDWNLHIFTTTLESLYPELDWNRVYHFFDYPEFLISDSKGINIVFSIWDVVKARSGPFPLDILFSTWKNRNGLFSLIKGALSAPIEIIDFSKSPRLQAPLDGLHPPSIRSDTGKTLFVSNNAWLSLDLIETLLNLGESDLYLKVRAVFKNPLETCPELLLCGLFQVNPVGTIIREELLNILMVTYLNPHPNSGIVLHRLWQLNNGVIVRYMVRIYLDDRGFLPRILDIAQDLKEALMIILDARPFTFAIDLATLASRREYLNLEKWLSMRILEHGSSFVHSCIEFLRDNMARQNAAALQPGRPSINLISSESVTFFMNILSTHSSLLTPEVASELNGLYSLFCSSSPKSLPYNVNEVEEESNSYFQKMYLQQLSVEQITDMLKTFKDSPNSREREIFTCMIHNLFDEYRFFSKYPEKELQITATLFGSLVANQLLSNMSMDLALRCVYDALRRPAESKLFRFGLWALEKFQMRLPEWPQFCNQLAQLSHLRTSYPVLVEHLDRIVKVAVSQGMQLSEIPQNDFTLTYNDTGNNFVETLKQESPTGHPFMLTNMSSNTMHPLPEFVLQQYDPSTQPTLASYPYEDKGMRFELSHMGDSSTMLMGSNVNIQQPVNLNPAIQIPVPTTSPALESFSAHLQPVNSEEENKQFDNSIMMGLTPAPSPPVAVTSKIDNLSSDLHTNLHLSDSGSSSIHIAPVIMSVVNTESVVTGEKEFDSTHTPPIETQDKFHVIINNVSKMNMLMKAEELKSLLASEYYDFFSNWFVGKRVSVGEQNLKLYLELVDHLELPPLTLSIVDSTYENIKMLLTSKKIVNSDRERNLLRNLGSWLGKLTIAKGKPLLAKKLDLKELILEAYESDRLIAVLPFVSKILVSCSESKIFKPPNPWIMAICSLLVEIHQMSGLGLNLVYEIEILFKELGLNVKELKPSALLASRVAKGKSSIASHSITINDAESSKSSDVSLMNYPSSIPANLSTTPSLPPSSNSHSLLPSASLSSQPQPSSQPSISVENANLPLSSIPPNLPKDAVLIPNLHLFIVANASAPFFAKFPHLRHCVVVSFDRAIRDIIGPVVERSVTIACITTRELVSKDFAMEPDENKMCKASHSMVQSLSASLALVTCKEPFRASITKHLASLLSVNLPASETALIEHTCIAVASDNMELCCNLIEKAASDRAVREIDDSLINAFKTRRTHREQTGQPYYEMSIFSGPSNPINLPISLRPRPMGGLSPHQLRVYDDFQFVFSHSTLANTTPRPSVQTNPPSSSLSMPPSSDTSNPSESLTSASSASAPMTDSMPIASQPYNHSQLLEKINEILLEIDSILQQYPSSNTLLITQLPDQHHLENVLLMIRNLLTQTAVHMKDDVGNALAQKMLKRLFSTRTSVLSTSLHLAILKSLQRFIPKIVSEITNWIIFSDDERAFDPEITLCLIREHLVLLPKLDIHLAKSIINARHPGAVDFAINIIRTLFIKEQSCSPNELPHTIDTLEKLAQSGIKGVSDPLQSLLEQLRPIPVSTTSAPAMAGSFSSAPSVTVTHNELSSSTLASTAQVIQQASRSSTASVSVTSHGPLPSPPTVASISGTHQPSEDTERNIFANDDYGLLAIDDGRSESSDISPFHVARHINLLFEQWLPFSIQVGPVGEKSCFSFIGVLQQQGLLRGDDNTKRFFRTLIEICFERTIDSVKESSKGDSSISPSLNPKADSASSHSGTSAITYNFAFLDSLSKLVFSIVKVSPEIMRIPLFTFFLQQIGRVLIKDSDRKDMFKQRIYYRLFSSLMLDFASLEPSFESVYFHVLSSFGVLLHVLNPSRIPKFVFSWINLISHRAFMPKLLLIKNNISASNILCRLLVDLFTFLTPLLILSEFNESTKLLYNGTLRILLVLLHDFPEFLCEYHFALCDTIPLNCIQMRNIVLSAFPRNMRLPDPFTPNLKVDMLPEISSPPIILSDVLHALRGVNFKADLDKFLSTRTPATFPNELKSFLYASSSLGISYDTKLINSLILYIGGFGIRLLSTLSTSLTHSPSIDIFLSLMSNLDSEGRYLVINAICNQLRYPNNHTHYFSCVLFVLFAESHSEVIQEQITRVLLERLIVHRPHPWGLLITFIELIKNPRYDFWSKPFTKASPEMERLFESVARSCLTSEMLPKSYTKSEVS